MLGSCPEKWLKQFINYKNCCHFISRQSTKSINPLIVAALWKTALGMWVLKDLIWSMVHKPSCPEWLFSFSLSRLFCSELQNIMRLEFVRLKNTLSLSIQASFSLSLSYTQAHANTHLSKTSSYTQICSVLSDTHTHTSSQKEDFLLSKPSFTFLLSPFRLSAELKEATRTSLRKWQLKVCLAYFCSATVGRGHTWTRRHTYTHVQLGSQTGVQEQNRHC